MNTDSEYAKKNYNVEITFKGFFFFFLQDALWRCNGYKVNCVHLNFMV